MLCTLRSYRQTGRASGCYHGNELEDVNFRSRLEPGVVVAPTRNRSLGLVPRSRFLLGAEPIRVGAGSVGRLFGK